MVSSILNTPVAIQTGIFIVKAFVKLRDFLTSHQEIGTRVRELEALTENHNTHIQSLWAAIEQLSHKPEEKPPEVKGFRNTP